MTNDQLPDSDPEHYDAETKDPDPTQNRTDRRQKKVADLIPLSFSATMWRV